MNADDLIRILNLRPHPREGGWFRETYRSTEELPPAVLPARYGAPRSLGTCIYYLLTANTFSALHRLASDEIFHLYLGGPARMLQLFPDGQGKTLVIGSDLVAGQTPQVVVPGGVWQGSFLEPGVDFALLGCTVAPGFDYADYEHGRRAELVGRYPGFSDVIRRLTADV